MKPQYMKTSAINSILGDFSTHQKHYQENDKQWFDQYLKDIDGLVETRFEFNDFILTKGDGSHSKENISKTDHENVKRLYSAMMALPEAVAVDQRFWIGLCHTEFWDYVQFRSAKKLKKGKDAKEVKGAYFWTNGVKRSAHVNCVSRLWWAGHMLYDSKHRSDPFWLLDVLTDKSFPSRLILLSSSNLTSNKDLLFGILEAIREEKQNGVDIKREHFVYATKYLNQMGSMTVLDCLSREYVKDLMLRQYHSDSFKDFKLE